MTATAPAPRWRGWSVRQSVSRAPGAVVGGIAARSHKFYWRKGFEVTPDIEQDLIDVAWAEQPVQRLKDGVRRRRAGFFFAEVLGPALFFVLGPTLGFISLITWTNSARAQPHQGILDGLTFIWFITCPFVLPGAASLWLERQYSTDEVSRFILNGIRAANDVLAHPELTRNRARLALEMNGAASYFYVAYKKPPKGLTVPHVFTARWRRIALAGSQFFLHCQHQSLGTSQEVLGPS